MVAVALFLPVTYLGFSELLGRPKPVELAWAERTLPEAEVISSRMVEDQAIYLWLAFEGEARPRAYELPWTQETARQLQQAQQEAEAQGTGVMASLPLERTHDELEKKFYPAPQDAPPPKQVPEGDALVVQRSDRSVSGDLSR